MSKITDTLTIIKSVAKRLARAQRLKHIAGLDLVARELGHSHWRGLAEAFKLGWRPAQDQLDDLEGWLVDYKFDNSVSGVPGQASALGALGDGLVITRLVPSAVSPMEADEIHGELDGHLFYLVGDEFSVAFGSQGWEIILDQPPLAKPEVRRLGGRVKSVAALDPAFVERATELVKIRTQRMRSEVASDWPRRSTMPDREGRALHPLSRDLSAEWYCLHCDGVHDGRTMAMNLWHCPSCNATPIDIFPTPFWNEPRQSVKPSKAEA